MRSTMAFISLLIAPAMIGSAASAQQRSPIDDVADLFQSQEIKGSIVVARADGSVVYEYNRDRAKTRFCPASTFKVLNTLIALDTGVVESGESTFAWNGTERAVAAWNRDQTLASAFKVSCVWCYQEIARSVGRSRYRSAFSRVDYGNGQMGDQVDQFWLDGSLQISSYEQIAVLAKIVDYSLPFDKQHIDTLKSIMLDDQTADYALYGKTGWTGPDLHVGWYIGFVEKGGETWLFALNMRMDEAAQAHLRKKLAVGALEILEVL